jgi:D-tyrosyl-tRNA(Tyr) deacylase
MIAVVTRVKSASVEVDGNYTAKISDGLLVLLGVKETDTEEEASYLAGKVTGLRIFEDENGKMGRSVDDIGGGIVVVPNFTLAADCRKGRRPDFTAAAGPDKANRLYEKFVGFCRSGGRDVQTGVFGGYMAVVSHNDGPVTIILDTDELRSSKK